jgi:hypothetical protein
METNRSRSLAHGDHHEQIDIRRAQEIAKARAFHRIKALRTAGLTDIANYHLVNQVAMPHLQVLQDSHDTRHALSSHRSSAPYHSMLRTYKATINEKNFPQLHTLLLRNRYHERIHAETILRNFPALRHLDMGHMMDDQRRAVQEILRLCKERSRPMTIVHDSAPIGVLPLHQPAFSTEDFRTLIRTPDATEEVAWRQAAR